MCAKLNQEQVRAFWTERATKYGLSPAVSWSDQMVIEMEIRQILKYLEEGDEVLDLGCANGYSTVQFAAQKRIHIRGVDYIPDMLIQARQRLDILPGKLAGTVQFAVGNILGLDEPDSRYDKVIVIRVVINLGEWQQQQTALRECGRVLKPGGLLLLSEATLQGWQKLNEFRKEWGLPDIPMPDFNHYLDQEQVIEAVRPELELVELVNFSSTYFVGTRVLKPLLARALDIDIEVANPNMEWNRWLAQLPAWGDYGTQKLFVFRKR